jgi:hypothetical protein
MNRIDNANAAGFGPGVDPGRFDRGQASNSKSGAASRAESRPSAETSQPPERTQSQQAAAEMLDVIADSVMQRNFRDINVLTASVTKFMLTSLEPAMQIAQEIRDQAADDPDVALESASAASHEKTLAVLSDGASS